MRKTLLFVLTLAFATAAWAAAEEFPLRARFPTARPIGTEALFLSFDSAVVVDVRSRMEYDVAHLRKSVHLPLQGTPDFLASLEKLRGKAYTRPLVFYCNGVTCAKSYQAAEMATGAGFVNVFVYDEGVMTWLKAHPDCSVLMGESPAPLGRLISEQAFMMRLLSFADFNKKATESGTIVVDIRDEIQHDASTRLPQNSLLWLPGVKVQSISSDRFVALVKAGTFKEKRLLIADAVGKQVRWVQFFLADSGYTDYYFLDKGVLGAVEAGPVRKQAL